MTKIAHKFIPFKASVIQTVIADAKDGTLFVLPNESSCRAAIRAFQPNWQFGNVRFVSMEDLKQALFVSDRPVLREEKRTLAFYRSLSSDDKNALQISHYFQAVEPAHHFFDLWQEFNEELVDESISSEVFRDADWVGWQAEMYERLQKIKQQYQKFIYKKGYSDIIFEYKTENIDFWFVQDFHCIVFVNQFYYTRLEKSIIERFAQNQKSVTIYFQLPEHLVDKKTLDVKPFDVNDLGDERTQKITAFECTNDFNQFTTLLHRIAGENIRTIVDSSLFHSPYRHLLSPARFNVGRFILMSDTPIYHFFQTALELLNTLTFERSRQKNLIPIEALINAVVNHHFCNYFTIEPDTKEHTLAFLYKIAEDDVKYIDMEGEFFLLYGRNEETSILEAFIALIKKLLHIQSIQSLVKIIDRPNGINISDIVPAEEPGRTEILDIFYRTLADFAAIEQLQLVDDWSLLFTRNSDTNALQTATGVLRLFVEYLKPKRIPRALSSEQPLVDIKTLLDTRNIDYQHVLLSNVIEGEIPHARQTPFLFTENQRQQLGLKTYDDVKLREKYYFMRLILTTPQVEILYQKNIEQNIETSSFLEEVRLHKKNLVQTIKEKEENYKDAYQSILQSNQKHSVNVEMDNLDFHRIPMQLEDFPFHSYHFSYYALHDLLHHPFVFFINHMAKLKNMDKKIKTDYSNKLIGNIVHSAFNRVWEELTADEIIPPFEIDFSSIDDSFIDRALEKTCKHSEFYYKSPHNHATQYFNRIMLPRLRDCMLAFFQKLSDLGFSETPVDIISEEKKGKSGEVEWLSPDENSPGISVYISGRADLQLKPTVDGRIYIFDYKTGSCDKEQLIFYELYYLLAKHPERERDITSFFYKVYDKKLVKLEDFSLERKANRPKSEYIDWYRESVQEALYELQQNGYGMPRQKSKMQRWKHITRPDLYVSKIK